MKKSILFFGFFFIYLVQSFGQCSCSSTFYYLDSDEDGYPDKWQSADAGAAYTDHIDSGCGEGIAGNIIFSCTRLTVNTLQIMLKTVVKMIPMSGEQIPGTLTKTETEPTVLGIRAVKHLRPIPQDGLRNRTVYFYWCDRKQQAASGRRVGVSSGTIGFQRTRQTLQKSI